ncbi:MAG: hypothetical protein L0323_15025 [Planctomycetes bacterium]|nr:hypothetical protein [Planctomycetota bacterium]
MPGRFRSIAFAACLGAAVPCQEPGKARWVWGSWAQALERPVGERCFLRFAFDLPGPVRDAVAHVASDNHFSLWANGSFVGRGDSWEAATRLDLARCLRPGRNVLALEARNDSGPAAVLFFADVGLEGGGRVRLESDPRWRTAEAAPEGWTSAAFDDRAWSPAREIGPYGEGPWAGVVWESRPRFDPLPGFRVEPVAERIGSVLAIAADGERILASVEGGGILRLEDEDRDGVFEKPATVSHMRSDPPTASSSPAGRSSPSGRDRRGAACTGSKRGGPSRSDASEAREGSTAPTASSRGPTGSSTSRSGTMRRWRGPGARPRPTGSTTRGTSSRGSSTRGATRTG